MLLLSVGLTACRSTAKDGSASNSATVDTSPSGALAVRLERGPCYGRCAEYVVELFDDGAVRFDGRRNVKTLGVQRGTIAVSAVRTLQQQFADAGFATADTAYVEGAAGCGRYFTDGPQTIVSVRIGTVMKTIHLDAGCTGAPRYLHTLASQVDSVARTSAWVTGTGEKPQ
jgi:hypothetical protein